MRKKTTALQRCDRVIRKARKHLKELQDCQSLYELEALRNTDFNTELQGVKKEIENVENYISELRTWRKRSLIKLQKWDEFDRSTAAKK